MKQTEDEFIKNGIERIEYPRLFDGIKKLPKYRGKKDSDFPGIEFVNKTVARWQYKAKLVEEQNKPKEGDLW